MRISEAVLIHRARGGVAREGKDGGAGSRQQEDRRPPGFRCEHDESDSHRRNGDHRATRIGEEERGKCERDEHLAGLSERRGTIPEKQGDRKGEGHAEKRSEHGRIRERRHRPRDSVSSPVERVVPEIPPSQSLDDCHRGYDRTADDECA